MSVLRAIPRWILVVLVVLLLIYLFAMVRTLTIGEGTASPHPGDLSLSLPNFVTDLVPSPPPVLADEVAAPCRTDAQLVLGLGGECSARVEAADERRRLTLVVTSGAVSIVYAPEDGAPSDPYTLPRDGDARAEFGISNGESIAVVLRCLAASCVVRIDG